jgi:hypothetical protein
MIAFSFLQLIVISKLEVNAIDSSISGLTIVEPSNQTYNSDSLSLNATVCWFFASLKSMSYNLDGLKSYPLDLESSKTEPFSPMHGIVIGLANLTKLSEGIHKIIVYAEGTGYFPQIRSCKDQAIIYFTIDTTSPEISILSIENRTYNQQNIPLNFTINEPTSWTAYSLDNQANSTINETLLLNGLVDGSHGLIIYANDTAGNMGKSENIFFSIKTTTPSPSPTNSPTQQPTQTPRPIVDDIKIENFIPAIIIICSVVIAIIIGTLNYLRKRRK